MTVRESPPLRPLALTMGEPAGIGGELTLRAWLARREQGLVPFVVIGDPERLTGLAAALALPVPVHPVAGPEQAAAVFSDALPVMEQHVPVPVAPGHPSPANGAAVLESIRRAVDLTLAGRTAAVVTNPIQKSTLYHAGFAFPGHTEYIAALARSEAGPVMMLACPGLRVVPVTVHIPIAAVPGALTADGICHCAEVTAAALRRDFGIAEPRLAVTGLNPHGGERGTIGREEVEIIAPAVARLQERGLRVSGPLPADTLFHARARAGYDAALCMYHDQALIPLKTLDIDRGVNITLGLPLVRTSPDHGTALDIAGQGIAQPDSLIAALQTAALMARQRAAAAA